MVVHHHPKDVAHPAHPTAPLSPDPHHRLRVHRVTTLEGVEDPVGVVHRVEVEVVEAATSEQVEVAVHHLPDRVENITADPKELHRKVVIK